VQAAAQALLAAGTVDAVVLVPEAGAPTVLGDAALPDDGVLVRPDGFAQANAAVNARLVAAAVDWAGCSASDTVLELFSGNGNFTFPLARQARHVTAVESAPIGVALAQAVARRDAVTNVRFVQGDAARVVQGLAGEAQRFDVLLVDPPRAGAPGLADWASKLLVRRVIYVSCDPGSLARDAKALAALGYEPTRVQVFDQFPQTHHVEALMAFERSA